MAAGAARDAEEDAIDQLRFQEENLFAIGSRLTQDRFDRWVANPIPGSTATSSYIHNKFMLIDPLSSSPVVVAGSANFSEASSDTNDENMLVIRDNTRVADIYLGEFMRLYSPTRSASSWSGKEPRRMSPPQSTFHSTSGGGTTSARPPGHGNAGCSREPLSRPRLAQSKSRWP